LVTIVNNTIIPKSNDYTLYIFSNKVAHSNSKIKLRFKNINPKITVGIMTMNDFKDLKFTWSNTNTNNNVYWMNPEGKQMNANYTYIAPLNQGDILISIKKQ
jgi:hypothetical protein